MVEYTLNGESIWISPEDKTAFLNANPSAAVAVEKEEKEKPTVEGNSNDEAVGVFAESGEETPVTGPVEETEGNTELESVDGSSEQKGVGKHDWLNYAEIDLDNPGTVPLFNLDEEDAAERLNIKYRGFTFESSTIGPSIDTEGPGFSVDNIFGSHNVVKATKKNSKGEIVTAKFEVGFDPDESHEEAYNTLTSFIDDNSSSEDDKAEIKAREDNIQAYKDHATKVQPSEEEKEELILKFAEDKDLFKPVEEEVVHRLGISGMDGKFAPTLPKTSTKVTKPYERELEMAAHVLETLGVENPTRDEVEAKAREILISESTTAIVENNTINLLEEYESSDEVEQPAYAKYLMSNILDLKSNSIPRQRLALGAREFELEYNAKITELKAINLEVEEGAELRSLKDQRKKLSSKYHNFKIIEGEKLVKLEDGRVVPVRVVDSYNNTLKSFTSKVERGKALYGDIVKNSSNIESTKSQMDLLRRSYNSWEEFTIETGVMFAEMGSQAVYGITKAFFPINAPIVDGKMINVSDWANGIRNSYAKDVTFENAFDSFGNFGSFVAQEGSNQIPVVAALAIPGGQALLFTSSFGSRYSDLVREDTSLTGKKTSETEKWFQSAGFGATELLFESMTTLPLIRNAKKAFLNNAKGNGLFEAGFKKYFKDNAAKSLVYKPLGEAVSEGATTISQNLISGTSLFEGLDHSMFSGLMFGTTFSSIPFTKGLYLSKFSDFETKQNARNKLSEMTELDNFNTSIRKELYELGGSDLGTEQDITDNEERITELREEYVAEMNKVESKYKTLSPRAAKDLLDAETRMETLRLEAARIKESSMPDDIKDSKLARIKMEFDQTNDAVEQFKASDTFTNNWTLFQANRKNKSETKRINALAKLKLSQEGNSDPDSATLSEEARIIYNKEYIKNDLKKSNGENKVVAHETVDETIAYLEKDTEAKIANLSKQNLSDSKLALETQKLKDDLQEVVYEVKNGANGFMDTNSKGEKISLVNIDNSAKNDRLETRTHEVKHAIFINALSNDPKAFKGLSDQVLDWTKNNNSGAYGRIISRAERRSDGSMLEDEVIAVFFEEVANGRINLETEGNSIFSGLLGFLAGEGSKSSADVDLDLAGETDAIKFLIGAAKKIKAGTLTLKEVQDNAIVKEASKTTKTNSSDTGKFSKEDVKPDVDELGSMGWTKASWKSGGADFALGEMQSKKMLDGLIAAKMKGGLRDGDNETKKDFISKVYSELTSHVKSFDPENNDSLFGWVNSQVGNKAGNVYNREYKDKTLERAVDVDATTSDGAPLIQIEADTSAEMDAIDNIGLTDIEVEQKSRLRRDIRLDDKMMQTVRDAVMKTFGTKLPDVNSKDFRKALEKAFRTELKKPIQDLMGTRSDFNLFLKNHYKAIIKALPVETLVQMERNLKPEQRIFTESRRITKPTEVDKLISQDKLPKDTNRTSGPQLHTKKDVPSTLEVMAYFRGENMMEVLGYKIGGSTMGTRKDKLAMELGVELAFDATSEVLQNPVVQEKRKGILEIQGLEQAENELAVIAKQIDRDPNIKFSKVGSKLTLGISNINKPVFTNKLGEVLNSIRSIASARDKKALYGLMRGIYSDQITDAELRKVAENISKYASKVDVIRGKVGSAGDVYINSSDFLKNFILQSVEKDVIEKSLIQLLSNVLPKDFKNATALGNDLSRVIRNRERFISFVRHAVEELGWSDEKTLRLVYTQYKGMMSGASKIADGRYIKDQDGDIILDPKWEDSKEGALDGNKWKRYSEKDKKNGKIPKGSKIGDVKRTKAGSPIIQDFRGQIFANAQDLIDEISRVEGFEYIKGKTWNQIAAESSRIKIKNEAWRLSRLTYGDRAEIGKAPNTDRTGYRTAWSISNESTAKYKANYKAWEVKYKKKKKLREEEGVKFLESYDKASAKKKREIEAGLGVVVFDRSTFSETSAAAIKDRNYEGRLEQAKEAREAVTELMTYYVNSAKEGIIDYSDVVMLGKMLGSGMTSPMKRAANLAYIGVGVESIPTKELGSKTEYEHMVPTNVKMLEMVEALINDGKLPDNFWDDYEVAIIPKIMDKGLIKNGLRDFKSPTQKPTDENWRRYYNKQMLGEPGIVALQSINPKDKGKIIGGDFVKASKLLTGPTPSPREALAIGNVLRKYSKGVEIKGASIWDFDDTLARTKSGVRYKLPNPSGTPQPGRKAIFMAGGAGSGKSGVVKALGLEDQGYKTVNQDISLEWLKKNAGLPTDMRDLTPEQMSELGRIGGEARRIAKRKQGKFKGRGDGVVIDGTGGSLNVIKKKVQEFKDAGYDVQMVFVETSIDVALDRNANRKERSLNSRIVEKNHIAVQGNKDGFRELFGDNFAEVNTDNLKQGAALPSDVTDKIDSFTSSYINARLEAGEFAARGGDLMEQGATFDFTEFNVVKDGKQGPLFNEALDRAKKYGTKDQFVLTARPMASAPHIQLFLKEQGLDIPLENVTGLASSLASSKADWIAEKITEGYNDIYFADDHLANVEAVSSMLDQHDVKSKVIQAKVRFSKEGGIKFNEMLERIAKVDKNKVFSAAQAKLRGAKVGGFKFFVPPSAEDFKGLLYTFLDKGKQGDADMAFFKEHLLDPFSAGIRNINETKQKMSDEYKTLKKAFPKAVGSLNNKVGKTDFTVDNAVRVYLWNQSGFEVPGMSKRDVDNLVEHVESNEELKAFADVLSKISRMPKGYVKPGDYWLTESIASDLHNITSKVNRSEFLAEWVENKDIIFSEENLNKIEAVYGTSFRSAMDDILFRMEKGTNKPSGSDKIVSNFQDWINGSVGAVMFFNTRSAVLQTLSVVNFLDWQDNNLFKAAGAFANQPQYWKDFMTLFNSDMLKQRRAGMELDVNMSELMDSVSTAKVADKSKAAIRYLLQVGFTPTQIADSFAISAGGATFYRNKIKKYLKEGMNQKDAEIKAFDEFQEIAEETQQSSRPDFISQQQAGTLGRLILAWANTPMQYTRLTKKAISDLVNSRGDWKSHVSRILYYGAAQNFIFSSLQTGLAFALFGGDEEEEAIKTKELRVANGMMDTLLRGTGIYGAMASTLKNTILQYKAQSEKGYGKQSWDKVYAEMISLSPPIGSKVRKVMNAIKTYEYNKGVPEKMGLRIDNPILSVVGNIVESTTNFPLDRLVRKANNIDEAITGQHELWQRVALLLGWNLWSIGAEDKDVEEAKTEVKVERKEKKAEEKKVKKAEEKKVKEDEKKAEEQKKKDEGFKNIRCSGIKSNGERCSKTMETKSDTALCSYHKKYKPNESSDRNSNGIKEYQCKSNTGSGRRCRNRTENTSKKCYAHQ